MAITKAQQYKQMLRDGEVTEDIGFSIAKPSKDGLRSGYRRSNYGPSGGGLRDSSKDKGSPGPDKDNTPSSRRGGQGPFAKPTSTKPKAPPGRPEKGSAPQINRFELAERNRKAKEKKERERIEKEKFERIQKQKKELSELGISTTTKFGTPTPDSVIEERKRRGAKRILEQIPGTPEYEEAEKDDIASGAIMDLFVNDPKTRSNLGIGTLKALEPILDAGAIKTRGFFADDVLSMDPKRFERNFGLTPEEFRNASLTRKNEIYGRYMDNRLSNRTDAFGNLLGGRFRDSQGNIVGGREGPDNQIIPRIVPTTTAPTTTTTTSDEDIDDINRGLAARFAGSLFDFSGLADGGRVPAMGGGIMNNNVIGGLADGSMDQMGRQMYGLGKLVKKATKTIGKIVKSPVGKAAIIGGLGIFGGGGFSVLKNKGLGALASNFFSNKNPLLFTGGKLSMAKLAGVSALAPLLFQQEEEEEQDIYRGPSIDIPRIRNNPYAFMAPRFEGSQFAADGGRIGYQEGGDAEPVAKKTMPLIDMDGMEKDYRETGGFVDMGRMERADDVPARLSKNEFVFTADAVRNAGEGDIDKGAEVMYNMMKNLESGGEVSEESQGLEGARKMFQTSQRLGEVI